MRWLYLLLSLTLISFGQEEEGYKIVYQRTDTRAEEKAQNLPVANKDYIVEMLKESEYELLVSKDATLFGSGEDYQVYHDLHTDTWIKKTFLIDHPVLIRYDSVKIDWKITSDKKKINDLTAIKATAVFKNQPVEAWFTPDIPVSAGPEFFHGLPGLILSLRWSGFVYEAKKIQKTKVHIFKPEAAEVLTEKEYTDYLNKHTQTFGGNNGIKMLIIHK